MGLFGLRVADASIMPTVVPGNTNAACIMIGENGGDDARGAVSMKAPSGSYTIREVLIARAHLTG